MSDIPSFPYAKLWEERSLRSVANLSRTDGLEFLDLAPRIPIRTETHAYPLAKAGKALEDLREGHFTGAAVIQMEE
jgi:propanol-preferring alcohol dehydrogenase